MATPGVSIVETPPAAAGLSARADVAVFVGLVGRRRGPLPEHVHRALEQAGWAGAAPFARDPAEVEALLDCPVAVESWSAFDALFAWDGRPVGPGDPRRVPCPLGLAVRSFFAEGGVRAWIVRTGDPLPLADGTLSAEDLVAERRRLVSFGPADPPADAAARVPLIPGFGGQGTPPDPHDPRTWVGAAHVWGIDDAAMLLVPDLPDLMAGPPAPAPAAAAPPPPREVFRPCAPEPALHRPDPRFARPALAAPRLDLARMGAWATAVRALVDLLARPRGPAHRRDVMLLASLPLPAPGPDDLDLVEPTAPLRFLEDVRLEGGAAALDPAGIGSARLQLAYPWVATRAAAAMPEGVEGAEGVLAGAIARTSLARGAFRSAAGTTLPTVRRTLPELGSGDLRAGLPGRAGWLGDALCLVVPRASGHVLLSDATAAPSPGWRAGGVSRLAAILLRAARGLGQELVFEPAGEQLWLRLRREIEGLMRRLDEAGAFAAEGQAPPFSVRCDRTTMSRNDVDQGRVIAEVVFTAAQPVERISVSLALTDARVRTADSEREVA